MPIHHDTFAILLAGVGVLAMLGYVLLVVDFGAIVRDVSCTEVLFKTRQGITVLVAISVWIVAAASFGGERATIVRGSSYQLTSVEYRRFCFFGPPFAPRTVFDFGGLTYLTWNLGEEWSCFLWIPYWPAFVGMFVPIAWYALRTLPIVRAASSDGRRGFEPLPSLRNSGP